MLVFLALFASGVIFLAKNYSQKQNDYDAKKMRVVASFYPLYFFAQQIGGDKVSVTNLTPAGGEPHDYEPTPQDIIKINKSKLLILNGGGLEAWGDKVRETIDPANTRVVVAGEEVMNQTIMENGNKIVDPHVWLAPKLAEKIVDKIMNEFRMADPENAVYYETRAHELVQRLADLDNAYRIRLANCTNRNLVTAHAAFGYLAAAYQLQQIPIANLSPDAEPSPRQLGEVIQAARDYKMKYIFFESLASPKLSETIAREIGAQTLVLNPIEGLTPHEIAEGDDYFTEMSKNLANLELACK